MSGVRGYCPRGGRSQTAVRGSNYGHVPPPYRSTHSGVVYSPPPNLPSTLKLSRLACSVCEYLKVLPEEENEAGISPSREVSGYPGGRKSLPENTSQIHKRLSVPLSLLNCLRNSSPRCHSEFKIVSNSDRKVDEESDLKNTNKSLIKRSAGITSGIFVSISLGQSTLINSDNSVEEI